jgi:hypothetical protein
MKSAYKVIKSLLRKEINLKLLKIISMNLSTLFIMNLMMEIKAVSKSFSSGKIKVLKKRFLITTGYNIFSSFKFFFQIFLVEIKK